MPDAEEVDFAMNLLAPLAIVMGGQREGWVCFPGFLSLVSGRGHDDILLNGNS